MVNDKLLILLSRYAAFEDGTQVLSQLPNSGKLSDEEDFLVVTPRKTIKQMNLSVEVCKKFNSNLIDYNVFSMIYLFNNIHPFPFLCVEFCLCCL